MRSRTILAFLLTFIILFLSNTNVSATDYPPLTTSSGIVSALNASYSDNISDTWTIAVPSALDRIVISYTCDLESSDYIILYSVDNSGNLSSGTTIYQGSGTFTTSIANGKAKIKFVTNGSISNGAGYKGFTIQYALFNSYSQAQVLNYQGNTILSGNVGIGVLIPRTKLDIAGGIRGNGVSGSLNIITDNGTLDLGPQDGTYSRFNTNKSYYLFDKTMFSSTGKYGALDQDLCFYTTWSRRMVINKTTGNVGIGVPIGTDPSKALTLKGGMSISPADISPIETCLGSLMITKPATGSQFINLSRVGNTTWSIGTAYGTNDFAIGQGTTSDNGFNTPYFRITSTGTVGIKTLNPNSAYALDVNGVICANEVKVTLDHFADFVFDSAYSLPKLKDVHDYIKINGHLPNIPSAKEVKDNGVGLAEMQVKLLQKVEELTLYVIEQQKHIEELENALSRKSN